MRVIIDARYVREAPSGIGVYIEAFLSRLPSLAPDDRFHLWTHPRRPNPVDAPNVTQRVVHAPADGLRTLLRPTMLGKIRRDDVVHFPYSLLGRGIKAPTVVTICDLMWLEHPAWVDARPTIRRVRQRFYQTGMRWALRNATRLIAISKATADRIITLEPSAKDRIDVTHLAVSSAFSPGTGDSGGNASKILGSDAPYYIVVGKNEPYEGHELAMQAFANAADPHDQLVMIQRTNPGRGLDRLAAQLKIDQRVRWLPNLPLADLVTLLRGAKALIQPSLCEGFGIPVLEAMACGCPVIASDTPALVEVMGGAGLHAAVGSASELASAIRKLDATRCSELSERGLARAGDFSWDRTAAATLDVYRKAAR